MGQRPGARSRPEFAEDLSATRDIVPKFAGGLTGARTVELAAEYEMLEAFPDCDVGAMPPFGNLFGVEVFVADSLAEDEKIAFNAGSFTELVQLPYRDFARLVKPTVLKIASKN